LATCVTMYGFGEGVKILCQVPDIVPIELKIGLPVKLNFCKIQQEGYEGIVCYSHKAFCGYKIYNQIRR